MLEAAGKEKETKTSIKSKVLRDFWQWLSCDNFSFLGLTEALRVPIKTQPQARDQAYTFSSLIWVLAEIVFSNHTSPNTFKILKGTILSQDLHRYFNGKLHFCYSNPILCHQFYLMVPMQSYILLLPNDSHFTMIMQVTSEYSVLWGALGFQTSLHIPEELSGGKFESLM